MNAQIAPGKVEYPDRLNINTTDLEMAVKDGCNPMQSLLDPRHDDLPYFGLGVGENTGAGHHASYSMSHIPGRWLNALLNAEDTLKISLDESVIQALARWTYHSFSHPMGLSQCLDMQTYDPIPLSDLHNLRETTHALYSLARFRQDERAVETAKRQISTIDRFYDFERDEWNEEGFQCAIGAKTYHGENPFSFQNRGCCV